jgi:hypothetical protein
VNAWDGGLAAITDVSPAVRILSVPVAVAILAVGWYGALLLWRGRTDVFDRPPGAWPYSETLWKGWVRSLVVQCLIITSAIGLILYSIWGPSDKSTARVVFVVGLVVAGLAFALGMTAIYWNRPKFVVPPHLRSEPGAVAQWYENRRRRRSVKDDADGPVRRNAP